MPDSITPWPEARPAAGPVILAGAGPGDPDLVTMGTVKALAAAEVVLYDHLVSDEVLAYATNPQVQMVCVGKRCGKHSMPQEEISRLIGFYALQGYRVVRLKGGDPMVFGRAGEEMDYLESLGLSVKVIPGVTAALGCAASAQVSLTRRGVARGVRFITAQVRAGDEDNVDWSKVADDETTLAVYMGRDRMGAVATLLMRGGLAADTPAFIVENGARRDEKRFLTDLAHLGETAKSVGDGPALLFVGRAMAWAKAEKRETAHAVM
jgi:uroporphyrin-III C-methyltransferase